MKLKFLGTSAGWPLPRLGCKCEICLSKDPRDNRTRNQLLVDGTLLLDIGPDTYFHLSKSRVDPTKIKYASITHEHADHTFGLWDLGHVYDSKKINVIVHVSTYKKISKLFFYDEYKVTKVEEGQSTKIDNLVLTLFSVNHTDSSFGIFVQSKNKSLFYAPDFKSIPSETIKRIKGVDLAILDGSEFSVPTSTHSTIKENLKLGKKLKAGQIYFTHIGHRTLPHLKLQKYVQREGGKNFYISFDGLEIKL